MSTASMHWAPGMYQLGTRALRLPWNGSSPQQPHQVGAVFPLYRQAAFGGGWEHGLGSQVALSATHWGRGRPWVSDFTFHHICVFIWKWESSSSWLRTLSQGLKKLMLAKQWDSSWDAPGAECVHWGVNKVPSPQAQVTPYVRM